MKSITFLGDKKLEIREILKPEPGPGEVLIEIKASGICGSDMRIYKIPSSQIPERSRNIVAGHEPCGVVAKLGTCTRNVNVGDRVMIHHYRGCGKCKHCLSGWSQLCTSVTNTIYGVTGNGGHEDFGVFPDFTCIHMPDELSFEEGACCSCGTGTSYQALKRLAVSGLDTIAIFGQGPVGLSATMFAKAMGAKVIAIDINYKRLESSKRFGADEIVDASKVDAVTAVLEITNGEGADATLECTGMEKARVETLKSTKIWGRACFVGEGAEAIIDITHLIIRKQLTVHGSRTFSTHLLAEVANFVVDHKVKLGDMIEQRFPLSKAVEAYERFSAGEIGKAVFVWP